MGKKQKELFDTSSIMVPDEDWKDEPKNTFDFGSGGSSYQSGNGGGQRCYHSHPPYKLPNGKVIHGGSCSMPAVLDADIYIGFDYGMRMSSKATPWDGPQQYYLPIPDMGVPESVEKFKQYVAWVAEQLEAGAKVHCGCIGGHGRTGMFLAALCKTVSPETEDAITHVRENYCQKAVESAKQVDWLNQHFGIKKVAGAKQYSSPASGSTPKGFTSYPGSGKKGSTKHHGGSTGGKQTINFMSSGCLWK